MAREVTPREKPAMLSAEQRIHNFEEWIKGYDEEQAKREAARCILCKQPKCQAACPFGNQIPRWMAEVRQGNFDLAYEILRETSPMPELCSRLCPQEKLCEGACVLGIKHEPVAVGLLERFVADRREFLTSGGQPRTAGERTGWPVASFSHTDWRDGGWVDDVWPNARQVACVGSGPASLAAAFALNQQGYRVTVFERWPAIGGVLRWIPRFKLSSRVLEAYLTALHEVGIRFRTGVEIGSVQDLLTQGFDAVFLGVGASRASRQGLGGDDWKGVMTSTEFLVRTHYQGSPLPEGWQPLPKLTGRRVVVLGGGDSAMDCLRTAVRLGAREATCVYRRDEANMPGSRKEVKAAKEEGVIFKYLTAPSRLLSENSHAVSGVECHQVELGEPDASGRRSPRIVEGSVWRLPADLVVLSFGYEVEDHLLASKQDPARNRKGTFVVHPQTGATPTPGVFAGGDCVTGPSLVSVAAKAGLTAAEGIKRYFSGEPWEALCAAPQPEAAAKS